MDSSVIAHGAEIAGVVAEALFDANNIGWDAPGVVTAFITQYVAAEPLAPGVVFRLRDGDGPDAFGKYLGPSTNHRGETLAAYGEFRILGWYPFVEVRVHLGEREEA